MSVYIYIYNYFLLKGGERDPVCTLLHLTRVKMWWQSATMSTNLEDVELFGARFIVCLCFSFLFFWLEERRKYTLDCCDEGFTLAARDQIQTTPDCSDQSVLCPLLLHFFFKAITVNASFRWGGGCSSHFGGLHFKGSWQCSSPFPMYMFVFLCHQNCDVVALTLFCPFLWIYSHLWLHLNQVENVIYLVFLKSETAVTVYRFTWREEFFFPDFIVF